MIISAKGRQVNKNVKKAACPGQRGSACQALLYYYIYPVFSAEKCKREQAVLHAVFQRRAGGKASAKLFASIGKRVFFNVLLRLCNRL